MINALHFTRNTCLIDLKRRLPGFDPPLDQIGCHVDLVSLSESAFPYSHDAPATLHELLVNTPVASHVAFELLLPEFWARGGPGGETASFVPVPEAAMHEYHNSELRKDKIRSANNVADMEAIPEAACM